MMNKYREVMRNDLALLPGVTPASLSGTANAADSGHRFAYERLVRWAAEEWQRRYPGKDCLSVWASESCANRLAHQRIKAGRKLGAGRILGIDPIAAPVTTPISSFYIAGGRVYVNNSVGAYIFHFELRGVVYDALFVSAYDLQSNEMTMIGIALVPREILPIFDAFERLCYKLGQGLTRKQKVHVVGGKDDDFEPTVEWDDVILSETIKAEIKRELDTFFGMGVGLYKQLGLPPFRKLLLVGPPGTGKTTICAALAKYAIAQRCIVIYVSAGEREGGSFTKISRALWIAEASQSPVLLIIEELDSFLGDKQEKSQILNVLDGLESPVNPKGLLLVATTNFPDVIDERIAKRPGRIDRVIHVPPIADLDQAERMLRRYMGDHYRDAHSAVLPKLIQQTGAFVREVSLYARMLAVSDSKAEVSVEMLRQSIRRLTDQVSALDNMMPRRPFGFGAAPAIVPVSPGEAVAGPAESTLVDS
jgi:DNA polymerase III delta prime subunit